MKNEIRRVGNEDRRAFMVFIGLPIEVFTRHDVNYGQVSHSLDLDLNGLLTRRNFGCIPGMLGTYTIPK